MWVDRNRVENRVVLGNVLRGDGDPQQVVPCH